MNVKGEICREEIYKKGSKYIEGNRKSADGATHPRQPWRLPRGAASGTAWEDTRTHNLNAMEKDDVDIAENRTNQEKALAVASSAACEG